MQVELQIYRSLWFIFYPLISGFMRYRRTKGKEDKVRFSERFGEASKRRPEGKLFWIHAASVGESLSAITLIERIRKERDDCTFLLTTGTVSSANIIASKGLQGVIHQYIPIDYKPFVKRFFAHWRPDYAAIIESELWPNLIDLCPASRLYLVNARLSNRSFGKWRWIKCVVKDMLQKFDLIMAQTRKDEEHFRYFVDNVVYTGNLKYSTPPLKVDPDLLSKAQRWRRKYVFLAASTHEGEDISAIEAYTQIIRELGQENVSLVIIPRHPDRSPKICELIEKKGYSVCLRSELSDTTKSDVLCVNSFGEMGTFFKIATFVFVGGSLVPIGGHNIFEPVQSGCPTMFGSHMFNFVEMVEFLENAGVAFRIGNASDMAMLFCEYVTSLDFRESIMTRIGELHSANPVDNVARYMDISE